MTVLATKRKSLVDPEIKVIADFNYLYVKNCNYSHYYLGIPILKAPTDLFVYHQIITEVRPDLIIETGTWKGGATLYMAHICDVLGSGQVLTVDTVKEDNLPKHPRINYLNGSSTDPAIVEGIKKAAQSKKVLVVLDSDHSKTHVQKELGLYSQLIQKGGYIIVEDSNTRRVHEAIDSFLSKNHNFVSDRTREKFLLTFNPSGYLLRIS